MGLGIAAILAGVGLSVLSSLALAQEPVRGGEISQNVWPEPEVLNTGITSNAGAILVTPKIIEGLLAYDREMKPKPELATEWSIAPDGRSITFKLRPGVKWHDGKDFTSADVAFSLMEVAKKMHPRGRATFSGLERVETPDPLTAVLVLSQPAPYVMRALAAMETPILPKHVFEGSDMKANAANMKPIGTGPFRFVEWQRGQFIVAERNPDYWAKGKPYLDRIVFKFLPDASARGIGLESGSLDAIISNNLPASEIGRLSQLDTIAIIPDGNTYNNLLTQIDFNLKNKYLSNVKVRQAIASAINLDFVSKAIWYGLGKPATGPIHNELAPYYTKVGVPSYPYNPAAAEKLLDEAGFPRPSPGAMRFALTLDFMPLGEQTQRFSEYLKQMLARIGIDVTIRNQDFATYTRRVYTDGDFDMQVAIATNSPDPTMGVQRFFSSKAIQKGVPFTNASGYSNPQVDRLLDQAQVEVDIAKRAELFAEFQRIVMKDLPTLPIVAGQLATLHNKRVHGLDRSAVGMNDNYADVWVSANK